MRMTERARVLVRFTDEHDLVWTVHDTSFSHHKHHRKAHGEEAATARVFVNAAGVRRSYTFKKGESRVLDPTLPDQQLRSAAYLPTGEPFDASKHGPR